MSTPESLPSSRGSTSAGWREWAERSHREAQGTDRRHRVVKMVAIMVLATAVLVIVIVPLIELQFT